MKYAIHRWLRRATQALHNRSVAIILLGTLVMLVFFKFITGLNLYVIFDGDQMTVHQSYTSNTDEVLAEAGIQISRDDYVSLPDSAPGDGVVEVHIERSHSVTLDVFGETRQLSTLGDTVGQALERAGIPLGAQDMVEPDVSTPITEGMSIVLWHQTLAFETETEDIPFETVRAASDKLDEGKEEKTREGVTGQKTLVYEISMRNGAEEGRRLVSEEVTTPKQDAVIEYGTKKAEPPTKATTDKTDKSAKSGKASKPSVTLKENAVVKPDEDSDAGKGGTLVTPSGDEIRYKKALNVTATAYTTEGHKNKRTARGTIARVGAIAVDPRVIPLGTRVYIEIPGGKWFYGYAVCEDTGGAIKGNIIDLFFNTESECLKFGRRKAIVYILE